MSAAEPTPPPFDAPASAPTSGADLPAWEARFRARRVGLPDWALDRPERAAVAATTSQGVLELHSWRVGGDQLLQATSRPDGTATGTISPDGEWLWWFDDDKGDERGIWRRQPFGSAPGELGSGIQPATSPDGTSLVEDATGLPPAYSSGLALGHTAAIVGSSDDEYGVRVHAVRRPVEGGESTTQLLYEHAEEAYVGDLSRDEQLVVLAHSEHGDSRHPALRVLRMENATTVADLWDGPGKGLHPSGFSPVAGDPRLLVVHEREGVPALLGLGPGHRRPERRPGRRAGRGDGRRLVAGRTLRARRPGPRGANDARARRPGERDDESGRASDGHGHIVDGPRRRVGLGDVVVGGAAVDGTRAALGRNRRGRRPAPRHWAPRPPARWPSRTCGSTVPAGASTRCCGGRPAPPVRFRCSSTSTAARRGTTRTRSTPTRAPGSTTGTRWCR